MYTIVAYQVYSKVDEEVESGVRKDLVALKETLHCALHNSEASGLLVWRIDRLSRDLIYTSHKYLRITNDLPNTLPVQQPVLWSINR